MGWMGEGGVGGDGEAESKLLICSACIYSTISLHLLHFQPQLMPFPPNKAIKSCGFTLPLPQWLLPPHQVRASAALEREQVVNEVRRQSEAEKDIAIVETKTKKWV